MSQFFQGRDTLYHVASFKHFHCCIEIYSISKKCHKNMDDNLCEADGFSECIKNKIFELPTPCPSLTFDAFFNISLSFCYCNKFKGIMGQNRSEGHSLHLLHMYI